VADLSLAATFAAAAPFQRGRIGDHGPGGPRIRIEPRDLRRNIREGRRTNLLIFCVDGSGSMAAIRRMEAVKGAVFALLIDAYQKRDQVALVSFRGRGARTLLPPTPSVERAHRHLRRMPTGGRTPLAHGLMRAFDLAKAAVRRDPRLSPIVVVMSDGRANVPVSDTMAPERELPRVARACRTGFNGRSYVIDTEPRGRIRLNRAVALAAQLGAEHVQLESLRATDMVSWLQQDVLSP
jgi:magnesium chelatase subunit D